MGFTFIHQANTHTFLVADISAVEAFYVFNALYKSTIIIIIMIIIMKTGSRESHGEAKREDAENKTSKASKVVGCGRDVPSPSDYGI